MMNDLGEILKWLIKGRFLTEVGMKGESYFIIVGHPDFRKNNVDRAFHFCNNDASDLAKEVARFLRNKEFNK